MTIPSERTRAVLTTKDFLFALLDPSLTPKVPKAIRDWAMGLVKHYPSTYDMMQAHCGAPNSFGKPEC